MNADWYACQIHGSWHVWPFAPGERPRHCKRYRGPADTEDAGWLLVPKPRAPRQLVAEWEHAVLRLCYGIQTAREIAAALGRSCSSVRQAAARIGLSTPRDGRWPRLDGRLRELHGRGWSDTEISLELGLSRESVRDRRQALGMQPNRGHPHFHEIHKRAVSKQCATLGISGPTWLRTLAFERFAIESGWPADLRPRQVQILNLLWERGPMTRRDIADEIGMPWKGSRKSLVSNDPEGSYLANLIARGMVLSVSRAVKGVGLGKSVGLYMCDPHLERNINGETQNAGGTAAKTGCVELPKPHPSAPRKGADRRPHGQSGRQAG